MQAALLGEEAAGETSEAIFQLPLVVARLLTAGSLHRIKLGVDFLALLAVLQLFPVLELIGADLMAQFIVSTALSLHFLLYQILLIFHVVLAKVRLVLELVQGA